jgi:D-glycero-alpha-D-manno-heptose-7-phosphate kinase|tara:strand:- start:3460 stop:4449 length:990 start_codon:yes stop_codon:yes gene_type:complete
MIISRTPVRVSFCGGGTDTDSFAESSPNGGMVTSLALSRYIHVTVNQRFDNRVRVSYSRMETVDNFEDIQHELVRESMRLTGVTSGIEITTIADIPSRGTGLGSSSAVTIGLLNALHRFAGRDVGAAQLAAEACRIEIDILGQPIGRQDQYAAAFGGVNAISFGKGGEVSVDPLNLPEETMAKMAEEFTLVFTGTSRSASEVLSKGADDSLIETTNLGRIREQADMARDLLECADLSGLGSLLNEAWQMKRGISSAVSNDILDDLYESIMSSGATGAKLLGAGGGGFFLVHGNAALRDNLAEILDDEHRMIPLGIDNSGSTIIFDDSGK